MTPAPIYLTEWLNLTLMMGLSVDGNFPLVRAWACVFFPPSKIVFQHSALPTYQMTWGRPAPQSWLHESDFGLHTWTCAESEGAPLSNLRKHGGCSVIKLQKEWVCTCVLYDNDPNQKMVLNTHLCPGPTLGGQLSSAFTLKADLKFIRLRLSQRRFFKKFQMYCKYWKKKMYQAGFLAETK